MQRSLSRERQRRRDATRDYVMRSVSPDIYPAGNARGDENDMYKQMQRNNRGGGDAQDEDNGIVYAHSYAREDATLRGSNSHRVSSFIQAPPESVQTPRNAREAFEKRAQMYRNAAESASKTGDTRSRLMTDISPVSHTKSDHISSRTIDTNSRLMDSTHMSPGSIPVAGRLPSPPLRDRAFGATDSRSNREEEAFAGNYDGFDQLHGGSARDETQSQEGGSEYMQK